MLADIAFNMLLVALGGFGVGAPLILKIKKGRAVIQEAVKLFDALPIANNDIGKIAGERPEQHKNLLSVLLGNDSKIEGLKF